MSCLKILMVASEAEPYARTGGLGDVMGALPGALAERGHEVKVVLPRYGLINGPAHGLSAHLDSVTVPDGNDVTHAMIERTGDHAGGPEFLFVGHSEYFGRRQLYVDPATGKDFLDNDRRFAFFSRAVLEMVKALNWSPDIIHVHDWQAVLVPVYLKARYADDDFFANCRTVLTIHNLGYQGLFDSDRFVDMDLPEELAYAATGALEFYDQLNYLKAGIVMADKITTVSKRYAQEIQSTEEFGCGLQGVLADRTDDLSGIVNGVDYSIWSPRTDKKIPHRYWPANLSGKRMSRVELLGKAGLPVRERTPLIGMVTRLDAQKGVDLVIKGVARLFEMNLQMVILGTGDEKIHQQLLELQQQYPDQLRVFLEFNDVLAHEIQAGSDMFLMPSRYEPCGLNQLYALKYGTIPIVREVGGLADTVIDYQDAQTGTGFVFEDYTAEAMLEAIERAVNLYARRQDWSRLMKAGMKCDFSWSASAARYEALFQSLTKTNSVAQP